MNRHFEQPPPDLDAQLLLLDKLEHRFSFTEFLKLHVLAKVPFQLRRFQQAYNGEDGHDGVINPIYWLTCCQDDDNAHSVVVELCLRVANPHPYWRHKTTHEVAMMRLALSLGIPTPEVLAFDDSSDFNWILMDRVDGVSLGSVKDKLVETDQACEIVEECRRYQRLLGKQKQLKTNGIHSFGGDGGGILHDGPPFQGLKTFAEYLFECCRWGIGQIRSNPHILGLEGVEDALKVTQTLMDTTFPQAIARLGLDDPSESLPIAYIDLHMGNILVKRDHPNVIVALIDYEACRTAHPLEVEFGLYQLAKELQVLDRFPHQWDSQKMTLFGNVVNCMKTPMWVPFYVASWFVSKRGEREEIVNTRATIMNYYKVAVKEWIDALQQAGWWPAAD